MLGATNILTNTENGIWSIRKKPKCPTYDCLGWVPKCYRERTVILFPEALEILKNLPKVKSVGKVIQRNESSQIIGFTEYPANFIFVKMETESPTIRYTRIDNIKKHWATFKKRNVIEDLQIKDLRTHFNYTLKSRFGFTSKEAGAYIGNTEKVNDRHYTPVSQEHIREKISKHSLFD